VKLSRRKLDDRSADALLSGRAVAGEPELSAFVAQVQALQAATPTPSPELAAMLEHGIAPEVLDRTPVLLPAPARRAVSWRYALVSLAAVLTGVLGAGAANALPAPAQRAVADVVGWITPLHLPHPGPDKGTPAVVPTLTPSAEPTDRPSQTSRPAPDVSRSPEQGDGHDGGGTDVRESPSSGDGGTDSRSGTDSSGTDSSGTDSSSASPTPASTSPSDGGSSDSPSPTPTSTPDSSGSGSGSSDSSSGSGASILSTPDS